MIQERKNEGIGYDSTSKMPAAKFADKLLLNLERYRGAGNSYPLKNLNLEHIIYKDHPLYEDSEYWNIHGVFDDDRVLGYFTFYIVDYEGKYGEKSAYTIFYRGADTKVGLLKKDPLEVISNCIYKCAQI